MCQPGLWGAPIANHSRYGERVLGGIPTVQERARKSATPSISWRGLLLVGLMMGPWELGTEDSWEAVRGARGTTYIA